MFFPKKWKRLKVVDLIDFIEDKKSEHLNRIIILAQTKAVKKGPFQKRIVVRKLVNSLRNTLPTQPLWGLWVKNRKVFLSTLSKLCSFILEINSAKNSRFFNIKKFIHRVIKNRSSDWIISRKNIFGIFLCWSGSFFSVLNQQKDSYL